MTDMARVSRRQGLAALGLTLGTILLSGGVAPPAQAGPEPAAPPGGAAGPAATPYQVTIVNNSKIDDENAIVFQQQPDQPADVHSLAWLSKMCHAGTSVTFSWTIDYNFVWGQTGTLKPGVNYDAGQVIDADLNSANRVGLSYPGGGFEFGTPGTGADKGTLLVDQDGSVPGPGSVDQGSVGIGMSGAGTFVVSTQPKTGVQFEITPTYWLAFGSYQPGTVITEDILTEPYQLSFPDGETSAVATFDGENWTVQYG